MAGCCKRGNELNFILPEVFHIKTKYNLLPSNTSITFMKYSLGYMFWPQLGHHQALYMYRSFILQYIYIITSYKTVWDSKMYCSIKDLYIYIRPDDGPVGAETCSRVNTS